MLSHCQQSKNFLKTGYNITETKRKGRLKIMFWIGFAVGLFVGSIVGIAAMCIVAINRQ